MWSARQLYAGTDYARSRALSVLSLFGIEFNPPKLEIDPDVDFDMNIVSDIPDKYAGLIIVTEYLRQHANIFPDIEVIVAMIKPEIMEFSEALFHALQAGKPVDNMQLLLAIGDRRQIKVVCLINNKPPEIYHIDKLNWIKSNVCQRTPPPIEGISYNLALLLENKWNRHNYVK